MFYIYILFLVLLDLFSKYLSSKVITEKINILWDFFYLQLFKNTWIAFSTQIPFLKILTISLIIWIFYYYIKEVKNLKDKFLDFSFILILSWAIWNWFERVFLWEVTDFLWIKFFAVFNLADIFISLGWIILVFKYLKTNKKQNVTK